MIDNGKSLHQLWFAEYHGMSGIESRIKKCGGIRMCNFGGNNGFCGGNMCWIIILILLFCCCGNGNNGSYGCGCDCDNNRCC